MLQEIIDLLKNKELVLITYGEDTGVIGDIKQEDVVRKVLNITGFGFEDQCILIGEIGSLYDYVQKIPEIAWDIVDFAERPLEVIYPQGKNADKAFLDATGAVKIRLEKEGDMGQILKKFPKGLFFVQVNPHVPEDMIKGPFKLKSPLNLSKRIIRLELDGEIKFIKK